MKNIHANNISQFARMVQNGHPIDKIVQCRILFSSDYSECPYPLWDDRCEYRVALAFVEGKPVFEGDMLYPKDGTSALKFKFATFSTGALFFEDYEGCYQPDSLSWDNQNQTN